MKSDCDVLLPLPGSLSQEETTLDDEEAIALFSPLICSLPRWVE